VVHKFSDFAKKEEGLLEGKKKKIEDILNVEITVLGYKVKPSKFQDKSPHYTTIQFEENGEKFVVFTSSVVLTDQLERYEEELPFVATIKKSGKAFTFT
jgi:hypothetical protein